MRLPSVLCFAGALAIGGCAAPGLIGDWRSAPRWGRGSGPDLNVSPERLTLRTYLGTPYEPYSRGCYVTSVYDRLPGQDSVWVYGEDDTWSVGPAGNGRIRVTNASPDGVETYMYERATQYGPARPLRDC